MKSTTSPQVTCDGLIDYKVPLIPLMSFILISILYMEQCGVFEVF